MAAATTTVHDYDSDHQVRAEQVNMTPWRLTRASTMTGMEGVIVWYARARQCCPAQPGMPVDFVPSVWDTTGTGTIDLAGHVQCGACGSLIYPDAEILHGEPGEHEVQAAARSVTGQVSDRREQAAAELRRDLSHRLRDEIASSRGRDDFPALDGMPEPGTGIDGGVLVAWGYDPRDPSGGTFLEVREDEL
jgi:hypothetical protein